MSTSPSDTTPKTTQLRYSVAGMDCAEEVGALKQTVGTLPGVINLDFNLLNGTLTVHCDEQGPDDAAIRASVRRAGLLATPVDSSDVTSTDPTHERRGWRDHRLVLCVTAGVLIVAGYLTHAAAHGGLLHALIDNTTTPTHHVPPITNLCYAVATLAGGWFVLPKAWAAVRRMRPDMNLLMMLAVVGAMGIGEWLEAAMVSFLFALSLLLESWSVGRARRAVKALLNVAPPAARYLCPHDGEVLERPVRDVPLGVTVLVRPGERIPLDGVVTRGESNVDQAPITGESLPVAKTPGDEVWAGTINQSGAIAFRVTRPFEETAISRIIRMVEEAQSRRSLSEQWVQTFARYYTPAMLLGALLVALVPPLLFGGAWSKWFYEALVLLVIACPCALVIATPVAIVAALSAAAGAGVLIKGGVFLETAARLRVIAIDKTGTVTQGRPEVQRIIPLNGHTEIELLERAAALETHSGHPLAQAIMQTAADRGIVVPSAEAFRLIQGRGAEGLVLGRLFWLGSRRLLLEKGLATDDIQQQFAAMEDQGHSVVIIGNDSHVCGLIGVADTVRAEAAAAIRGIRAAGVDHIVMLTGDNTGTAQAVARAVGIEDVRAEQLPEDKLRVVEDLVRSSGPTAMIGDGINDAPALAAATLGIAMGAAGSDAAIETADIALMSDDLTRIPWLIRHARRTLRIILQNIAFALTIKAFFIALTLMHHGSLWLAIAADMGASLIVIFNALRLLHPRK